MRLYHSPTSPYVRKVMVTAIECGLDRIRDRRPKLFAWYDAFARRPSMQATTPKAR